MYRCGPCKVMLPMLEDLAQDLEGKAEVVKFNCNAKNKDLGKSLNIKVAPTFHIYKKSNKVGPTEHFFTTDIAVLSTSSLAHLTLLLTA